MIRTEWRIAAYDRETDERLGQNVVANGTEVEVFIKTREAMFPDIRYVIEKREVVCTEPDWITVGELTDGKLPACKGCGASVGSYHEKSCEYAPYYSTAQGYPPRKVDVLHTKIAPLNTRRGD